MLKFEVPIMLDSFMGFFLISMILVVKRKANLSEKQCASFKIYTCVKTFLIKVSRYRHDVSGILVRHR